MPSPWVKRSLDNSLPGQAYAGTAAHERASEWRAAYESDEEAYASIMARTTSRGYTSEEDWDLLAELQEPVTCDHAFGTTDAYGIDRCAECGVTIPCVEPLVTTLDHPGDCQGCWADLLFDHRTPHAYAPPPSRS